MAFANSPSECRIFLGRALVVIGDVGFLAVFGGVMTLLTELSSALVVFVVLTLIISAILVVFGAVFLKDESSSWQTSLVSVCIGAVTVGLVVFLVPLFHGSSLVFGRFGLIGVACLLVGAGMFYITKYLQARFLVRKDI